MVECREGCKEYLESKATSGSALRPTAKKLAAREGIDLLTLANQRMAIRSRCGYRTLLAERPKPLSRMRQIIAQRLTESFTHAPHFF